MSECVCECGGADVGAGAPACLKYVVTLKSAGASSVASFCVHVIMTINYDYISYCFKAGIFDIILIKNRQ